MKTEKCKYCDNTENLNDYGMCKKCEVELVNSKIPWFVYVKSIMVGNKFDCDACKQSVDDDVYQDESGNIFVCQECFDKSNDGMYFISF